MKKVVTLSCLILVVGVFLTGCMTTAQLGQDQFEPVSEEVMVMSRGVKIPATVVHPQFVEGVKYPIVVLAHGHGGGRQENGGFGLIAERMASAGIISIRMDFPGCGDSSESFVENNLTNMLIDIESSRQYVLDNYEMIDTKLVGIMGYSMGGRLAIHSAAKNPGMWKAIGMLAPSADPGGNADFLGGPGGFQDMMDVAEKDGLYLFTTPWGQQQQLGYQFFVDMKASDPQDLVKDYNGPLFAVTGTNDMTVPSAIVFDLMKSAVSAESTDVLIVDEATHGYGFYSDRKDIALTIANALTDFFIANFK